MSERTPNFSVGQSVKYGNKVGSVEKVWEIRKADFKYTVLFSDGRRVLKEGQLRRA